MGTCRIQHLVPPCGYREGGIDSIRLLDFDDFNGFEFGGTGLYDDCLVTDVLREGNFAEVDAPDTAKYNSVLQNGVYTHTLETFVGELSAELASALHLATKRRYIVVFRSKSGRHFIFGYEAGALVSYASQTADGIGSLVTISATSIYPLFEVSGQVMTDLPWVLEDGTWNMSGLWYDSGAWKY